MRIVKSISASSSWMCLFLTGATILAAPEVTTVKAPDSAYRPQVVLDGRGALHMVYSQMEKGRGDLFYSKRDAGAAKFSTPIQVNSTPHCAAGFNMAVGKGGRVHVIIRPNAIYSRNRLKRKPVFNDLKYMLYCRLNDKGTEFEDERDLSEETFGFEGVGALIADGNGTVRAFWHGLSKPGRENTRQIFAAKSADEGKTFSRPQAIQTDVVGACACCSTHGAIDADGNLYLAFRNSETNLSKDSYLLISRDGGKTFEKTFLDPWPGAGCPGSTYSLTSGPSGVYIGWDTKGEVFFSRAGAKPAPITAPTFGKFGKSPVVAANSRGEVLFAWAEAANPKQFRTGGDLAWVIYDKSGQPISKRKVLPAGVARWSSAAAYAKPDGDFVILYDGPGEKR